MRMTENVIAALISGMVVGSIITYFYPTREKRAISSIRKDIGLVSSFLDLSPAQWSRVVVWTGGGRRLDQGCLRR